MKLVSRDYFAELYVAGVMADAGWTIYFPHRDRGMDFIATRAESSGVELIRPVQVKGKYPIQVKTDKSVYGYVGGLNQIHPEMVLAIPYFRSSQLGPPEFVAFMPLSRIRRHKRGFRCQPACFKGGKPVPRRDFARFVDSPGLDLMKSSKWSSL